MELEDIDMIHLNNHITQIDASQFNTPTYPFSNANIVKTHHRNSANNYSITTYGRKIITNTNYNVRDWTLKNGLDTFVLLPDSTYRRAVGVPIPASIEPFFIQLLYGIKVPTYYNGDDLAILNTLQYRRINIQYYNLGRYSVTEYVPMVVLPESDIESSFLPYTLTDFLYNSKSTNGLYLRNIDIWSGAMPSSPFDFTVFYQFPTYHNSNQKMNGSTKFFKALSTATSNTSAGNTFASSEVFRTKFTGLTTGLEVKYQITAKLRYLISHTRPIKSTTKQSISTRIIAGRKYDEQTQSYVLNQVVDTFTPDTFDWCGDRTITLSYTPPSDDTYMGANSANYSANRLKNQGSMTDMYTPHTLNSYSVYTNQLQVFDFDKELTIDIFTNENTPPRTPLLAFDGAKFYDMFQVYLLDLKVVTTIASYSSINNTLWTSKTSGEWLLPIDTLPLLNTKSIRTINSVRTESEELVKLKFGNGTFVSGLWLHGCWNQGWRKDTMVRFYPSIIAVKNTPNEWLVQLDVIDEDVTLLTDYKVGDKISVSNIIGKDSNYDRIILNNYALVMEVTSESLIVKINTPKELIIIEQDSDKHLINTSKNIWLNGVFFNGYFSGIFNYGVIKGYSKITKIENSHIIDGIFDGGHLVSNSGYTNKYKTLITQQNSTIKKEYNVSLVQNFIFHDNNYASNNRFVYDSWIDLAVDKTHKSVFLKNNNTSDINVSFADFKNADTNGFIIEDILSSTAHFRETSSQTIIAHKLGTKYKVINSFIMDDEAEFKNDFNEYIQSNYHNNLLGNRGNTGWNLNLYQKYGINTYNVTNPYNSTSVNISSEVVYLDDEDILPKPHSRYLNIRVLYKGEYYVCFASTRSTAVGGLEWAKTNYKGQFVTNTLTQENQFIKFGTKFNMSYRDNINITTKLKDSAYYSDYETYGFRPLTKINNTNVKIDTGRYTIVEYKINHIGKYNSSNGTYNNDNVYNYNANNLGYATTLDVPNADYHPNGLNEVWYIQQNLLQSSIYQSYYQPKISLGYLPNPYSMNLSLALDSNGKYLDRVNTVNYEYFYNKTDLDLSIYSRDSIMVEFDYIKMMELDMIPFYKYTNGDDASIGINTSVTTPWLGIANLNYNTDLGVLGNVNINRDFLNELVSTTYRTKPLIFGYIQSNVKF